MLEAMCAYSLSVIPSPSLNPFHFLFIYFFFVFIFLLSLLVLGLTLSSSLGPHYKQNNIHIKSISYISQVLKILPVCYGYILTCAIQNQY
ncbi:hypothetical protein AAZX31_06G049500 [Glycine max]|uniref:Uncharacterized protein n=2 Tax=Glycine subgen. Soja TaxID=1462606 RepID=K7KT85_SOYBN|nr:hypothetical protein JHK87_014347 [Glycine soja]KAG5030832.1 hypothetical protein JHK85_014814 [Glycine max]KAG5045057.1 hypothetical protein JHK86_014463 [Glycine max]KAG5147557.1 hypothetical protein JHK82_014438 [Glycine max]KAH1124288.1 hypothetical protein GYH30_014152 [Glycine max]